MKIKSLYIIVLLFGVTFSCKKPEPVTENKPYGYEDAIDVSNGDTVMKLGYLQVGANPILGYLSFLNVTPAYFNNSFVDTPWMYPMLVKNINILGVASAKKQEYGDSMICHYAEYTYSNPGLTKQESLITIGPGMCNYLKSLKPELNDKIRIANIGYQGGSKNQFSVAEGIIDKDKKQITFQIVFYQRIAENINMEQQIFPESIYREKELKGDIVRLKTIENYIMTYVE